MLGRFSRTSLYFYATLLDEMMLRLGGLPDLERILSRIHSGTARIKDFVAAIQGFKDIHVTSARDEAV